MGQELPPPPPFPFSAESKIRVDKDGKFWEGETPVTHRGLAAALPKWIDVHPDGRYILRNELSWCYIEVEDAPLVVTSAAAREDGGIDLALTDGTVEPLDLTTLRIDEDDVPYCNVRGGRLPARFSRQAAFVILDTINDIASIRRVPRGNGARGG